MSAYLSTDPTVYADFTFVVTDTGVGAPVNNIAIEYYDQAYAPANFIAGGSLASVLANGYYPPLGFPDRSYRL
ncbi:hypothetical protein SSCH_910003 [Syntrophaceticus schinkii]|jgi:hypothetical protein|uniref:Uncharacterized protein n=1 Tax=Syntrophaceticus schinkii TaxID=499207 RepID=A0A0B7MS31_9FIRM|nr:hypothetical protein SSCH_910003 [Syntrophaceticus schinkii]